MVQFVIIHNDSSQIPVLRLLVLSASQLIPCLSVPRFLDTLTSYSSNVPTCTHAYTHTHKHTHTHTHSLTHSLILSLSIFSPSVLDVRYSRDTEPVWLNLLSHPISLKFILTVLHHNRSAELVKGVVGIIYFDKS